MHSHDGDSGSYPNKDIFPIKPVKHGHYGPCIAYYDDRAYAFKGRVIVDQGPDCYVRFDDGDWAWIPRSKVYEYESL